MHWILASSLAAFFQNARSSVQKKLNTELSLMASTYVRFSFSLPIVLIIYFLYYQGLGAIYENAFNFNFLSFVFLGSLFQILFTFLFLYLFKFTNFLVGTTLSKTEVIQIALFEFIILNEYLNKIVIIGIVISTIGVIIFTTKKLGSLFKNFFSKSTLVGILCGTFLALSIVCFRGSMLQLTNTSSNVEQALNALFFSTLIQTMLITIYLTIFEKQQYVKIKSNLRLSCLAGLFGFLATSFWFYAFSLIPAAFVRTVGQIELLFSYFSSTIFFKEKVKTIEIIGILIFILGVTVILVYR